MAKRENGPDDLEHVKGLFPKASHKLVDRVLRKAREKEARAAQAGAARAVRALGRGVGGGLGAQLGKAVSRRGKPTRAKASTRQVAPDTGGRSFHFARTVTRRDGAAGSAGGDGGAKGGAQAPPGDAGGGGGKGSSKAAVHQRYINRDGAVERAVRDAGAELGPGAGRERGREPEAGRGRDGPAVGPGDVLGAARAGQRYITDPAKLPTGETVTSSWGTIGDTLDEQMALWEKLEAHSYHKDGRVQNRLILELPHQASPEARAEIVRRFCERFERDGVPYHAALHAPGAKNDPRNTHAHVVFAESPARRMIDPATGREE